MSKLFDASRLIVDVLVSGLVLPCSLNSNTASRHNQTLGNNLSVGHYDDKVQHNRFYKAVR